MNRRRRRGKSFTLAPSLPLHPLPPTTHTLSPQKHPLGAYCPGYGGESGWASSNRCADPNGVNVNNKAPQRIYNVSQTGSGHYCQAPQNRSELMCPGEFDMSICPGGYYCPNSGTAVKCPKGSYCPRGSFNHIPVTLSFRNHTFPCLHLSQILPLPTAIANPAN